jgi:hypothetical protein
MARKNTLREVKGFGGGSKTKNQEKLKKQDTIANNQWKAWQCRGEADNPANWQQVWEGSLNDCFEVLREPIYCQLEQPMEEDGSLERLAAKYEHEPEVVSEILGRFIKPKIANLKSQCLKDGGCKGEGWIIAAAPSKFKQQINNLYPFAYSNEWEAGAEMDEDWDEADDELDNVDGGDIEEDDDDRGSGNWGYVADGSLSDCLQAIMPFLTIELEMEDDMDYISDDMNIENFFKGKIKKRSQKLEEIRKACLTNGEYKGRGWQIRSQRTRQQCEYMADNGYPSF